MPINKNENVRVFITLSKDNKKLLDTLRNKVFKNKTASDILQDALICYAVAIADTFKDIANNEKEEK